VNAEALGRESFGIITEINVRKTLKEMIGADFRNYGVIGSRT
jgi:hypothetical protein